MTPPSLLEKNKADVKRALGHLRYSFEKVRKFDLSRRDWTEEELETLESFSSRFARAGDLIVSRLLRSLALDGDPGFSGTVIDLLNLAEKNGWIASAQTWARVRALRNVAAHDYAAEDFSRLIAELAALAPSVLDVDRLT